MAITTQQCICGLPAPILTGRELLGHPCWHEGEHGDEHWCQHAPVQLEFAKRTGLEERQPKRRKSIDLQLLHGLLRAFIAGNGGCCTTCKCQCRRWSLPWLRHRVRLRRRHRQKPVALHLHGGVGQRCCWTCRKRQCLDELWKELSCNFSQGLSLCGCGLATWACGGSSEELESSGYLLA
jgi:hypothetical protein